ncbi:MAG: phage tail tape measure protein, partial [Erysipelotrichaceae bacterium]|nr:phage tail tape measure protein [Erysipelotrichaceae bacterium]
GELQDLETKLYNSAGAGQEMADIMSNTLEGSTKKLASAWEELKLNLYDGCQGAFRATTDALGSVVQGLNNLWSTGYEFSTGFGENISAATKVAIQGFVDTSREVSVLADQLKHTGGEVTQQFAQDMAISLENWAEETTTLLNKTYEEDLAILKNYFESANIEDENHKQDMINRLVNHYDTLKAENHGARQRINEIVQKAYNEQRQITAEEQAEIERIIAESNEKILKNSSSSADEELALMDALASDKSKITKESAEKLIKEAKSQKEKVVEAAKSTRDDEIKQAYRLKEIGAITEDEYTSMVKTANDKYTKMEKDADKKFKNIKKSVSDTLTDMRLKVDEKTGKIKRDWMALIADVERNRANFYYDQTITTVLKERDERKVTKGRNVGLFSNRSADSTPSLGYQSFSTGEVSFATKSTGVERSYGSGVNVSVGNMTVRNDSDINRIAEELYRLQQRKARSKGVFGNV